LGRFVVGNPGGPGRPRRATEAAYQQALSRVLSAADLEAIARRAVADARRGSARPRDRGSASLLGNPRRRGGKERVTPARRQRCRVRGAPWAGNQSVRASEPIRHSVLGAQVGSKKVLATAAASPIQSIREDGPPGRIPIETAGRDSVQRES